MSRFASMLEDFFYRPDEDIGPWFEVSAKDERVPPPPAADSSTEYLAFVLEGESFALPIQQVKEIVTVRALTEVPGAGQSTLGIINLRGEMTPVYDIRARLHLAGAPLRIAGPEANLKLLRKTARILIVQGNEDECGLFVDQIVGVARLRSSTIEPPPSLREAGGECVTGLGRWEGRVLLLLDVRQVLV